MVVGEWERKRWTYNRTPLAHVRDGGIDYAREAGN